MSHFPQTPGDDESLRRLLDDAVSDVEPRDALGSIHARTKVIPMQRKRSWILGAAAAAVATAATVTAVAVMGDDPGATGSRDPGIAASPSPTAPADATPSPDPTPSSSPDPSPSKPGEAAEEVTVPVYYVGETTRGPRLYREFHSVLTTQSEKLQTAVKQAVAHAPDDPDYVSPWPEGTAAGPVTFNGDVITVDLVSGAGAPSLHDRPQGMSEDEAAMAVEQVIYTAQAALQQGRPGVQLTLDGKRTDMVLGTPASEPLAEGAAIDVLAQVWVIEPADGAEVTSPFKVSGVAASFEANVQWELMRGDKVVKNGFTTARECCTMAPYSFKVNAPPGEYTLVVHDEDASGGEGYGTWQDTKRITVR